MAPGDGGGRAPVVRPSVVYIGGSGRSGSTILARRLGQQPGFAAVGELRYVIERGVMQNHLCGCGEPFLACPFWAEVFGRVLGGFDRARCEEIAAIAKKVDRIRYIAYLVVSPRHRPRGFQKCLQEYGQFLFELYSAVAQIAGADVIVDSSKDPSYAFVLRSVAALDVSVLHLVRDSRAVAYSWTRSKVRPEIHWKVEYMRKRRPLRSAWIWIEYNLLFERWVPHMGRLRHLRYEDFTADPDQEVAGIVGWAHASAGPTITTAEAPFQHNISGNPIRFSPDEPAVRRDVEWRSQMPAGQRRLVTAVTAPLLARYRYRLDGRDGPIGRGARRGARTEP
jgi:Sulfotransferase family